MTPAVGSLRGGDAVSAVKDLVSGGVDHAFECVGNVRLIRNATRRT